MAVKLTVNKIIDSRNLSRYEVAKRSGISYQILDNYYKNKVVRYDSYILNKLCNCLNCDISDLIEYSKDK